MTTPSTFSYDVIFTMGADQILARFKDFDAKVVFSAEGFCWPDESLAVRPLVHSHVSSSWCPFLHRQNILVLVWGRGSCAQVVGDTIYGHITPRLCIYMHTLTHTYMYIHTCTFTYAHTHTHVYTHTCIHTYTFTYAHTHRFHWLCQGSILCYSRPSHKGHRR